jgi:hypothetical protein
VAKRSRFVQHPTLIYSLRLRRADDISAQHEVEQHRIEITRIVLQPVQGDRDREVALENRSLTEKRA